MKFYQTKIFKIIMSLIALMIIFKYSLLVFLSGVGLVIYLNKKNLKFKSFPKLSKIILSSFLILFTLLIVGVKSAPTTDKSVASNSKVETTSNSTDSADKTVDKDDTKTEVKEDDKQIVQENVQQDQATSNEDNKQPATTDNSTATASSSTTASNDNSAKSSGSANTNSIATNNTSTNSGDENTIVYYVPGSNVYHLSKNDTTLRKSKNIQEITLKDALARGMHQSKSKADN